MDEKYYSVRQVANQLGLKTRTVREWIRAGKLLGTKYGVSNRWFVSEAEIKRLRCKDADKR